MLTIDPAPRAHMFRCGLGAPDYAGDADAEHAIQAFSIDALDRRIFGPHRVVDDDVDPAKFGRRGIERLVQRGAVGHVAAERDRLAAIGRDLLNQIIGPMRLAVEQRDRCAVAGEFERDVAAEAARRAGDERNAPFE